MQERKGLVAWRGQRCLLLSCLLLSCLLLNCLLLNCLLLSCLFLVSGAKASAQQPNEEDNTPAQTSALTSEITSKAASDSESASVDKPEKRFRWTTTGRIHLRYGSIRTPRPTNLFAFDQYNEDNGQIHGRIYGDDYDTYDRYLHIVNIQPGSDEALTREGWEERRRDNVKQLFQSYNTPSLEAEDVRLDLYELLLNFEASSSKEKKWQSKARVALDVFDLGESLSERNRNSKLVQADAFDSAFVQEAFVSLSRVKLGELRLGLTDGVVQRLDAGAHEISASNEFLGDTSQTPWHIKQLGWELGKAASDNFPKIQYLTPKFYGITAGAEWFSNLRSPDNSLQHFSRDSSSFCFPSLFYTNGEKLFEQKDSSPFRLYDNTKQPLATPGTLPENIYYLQKDFLPKPVLEARCWQRSPVGSSWHEDARPSIMGGNFAVAYEKDFPQKKLSLKFAARYGVRFSNATETESDKVLRNIFTEETRPNLKPNDAVFAKINRNISVQESSFGFSTGLTWRDYSLFGSVTSLLPSDITLENLEGKTLWQKGSEGLIWSVGIKVAGLRLTPHKKRKDGTRKRKGAISLSFTQAITKDPRYDDGKTATTILLNLQNIYPITDNIALVADYWYGEAAVFVPFFVTTPEAPSQGVLFFERRFVPNHEFLVGVVMHF